MSTKTNLISMFFACVVSVNAFGSTQKHVNRGSNADFCWQTTIGSTPTDAFCAKGTSAVVAFPKGSYTALTTGADAATSLALTDSRMIIVTPTAARIYTLPTTSVLKGDMFTFTNNAATSSSNLFLSINSSGANLVRTVYPQSSARIVALQDTPTTAAHWACLDMAISEWTPYTPSGGWSNTSYKGQWRRVGDSIHVKAQANVTGAASGGNFIVTIPTFVTPDDTKYPNGRNDLYGTASVFKVSNSTQWVGSAFISSGSGNYGVFYGNGNGQVTNSAPISFSNGDKVEVAGEIPVVGWTGTKG